MSLPEPLSTAAYLAVLGLLLALAVASSRLSARAGVPAILVFRVVGIMAGSEGIGGIHFSKYQLAFRIGTVALAMILFDGGLNTSVDEVRRAAAPAGVLATLGVLLTALLVAVPARLLGFAWWEALLLGVVVSSTDAAAVFSILRGSTHQLQRRVAATLDLESGLNDPLAVILTISLTMVIGSGQPPGWGLLAEVAIQFAVGAGLGLAFGYLGRWVLRVLGLGVAGLYPVLTLAFALLAFAVPTLLWGSGFLAVYIAGFVIGNGPIPFRGHVLRAHDFIAWLAQVAMFLTMGLLVFPSDLVPVVFDGLTISLFLVLVARPLAVAICLSPFRFGWRERLYIGWVGLRGAVPIILASYPLMAGIDAGLRIFNVVFFVVLVSVLLQGSTTRLAGRLLRVERPSPPFPPAVLEIHSGRFPREEILSFFVRPGLMVAGARVGGLPLPAHSAVILIIRGDDLLAPRDDLPIEAGDHVYLLCDPHDRTVVRLLFGQEEDEG